MKRPLKPEELKIWGLVAATVHPLVGRDAPKPARPQTLDAPARIAPQRAGDAAKALREGVDPIEPNRRHRISREREEIGGRLDLHGLTQERARAVLDDFLKRAQADGVRAVLIITGKGVQGDGVLRRRVPDWLGAPHLSHVVAGISEAHRRHGGAGALYVALKRRPRP
ncbi:Smr/MutS family protein [Phenylobacterium sp. SCN 70-31]|uniref:Smr/MutS family protein n=1 Tax=Phenylobacterium sp. SCN 70-31 TaxID=1660129 RepID=UPI00086F63AF|nr:Smr/MutS family protein [Phenylobacterium sp. SCN 70-31]ODT87769.1 MAG: DNA mismatch repair protein MutS [Phenylobacterium sp. SCN 70-31]